MKFHLNTEQHFFYCEGDQGLAQVAQRGCEVSICGVIYTVTGHGLGQPAVVAPALSWWLDWIIS